PHRDAVSEVRVTDAELALGRRGDGCGGRRWGRGAAGEHHRCQSGQRRTGTILLMTGLACVVACAPRPLLERAIRAGGGPLPPLARAGEADVQAPFAAGHWTWRTLFQLPDRYAWSIDTLGEPNHYLFDGAVTRLFLGRREINAGAAWNPPLRS